MDLSYVNHQNRLDQEVFLLEKSSTNLQVIKKDGEDYILEGTCAIFGEVNNNGRIYEEAEYMPHLEYLREKIKANRLVGELDHPEKFDISLKHISHKIESLDYIKESREIRIRVRLLDTPHGRIAKTLVDAGIPVSISSRAAGVVQENKKVKIKKIFTYDLVCDPGFEKAQLERVYESANCGLDSSTEKSIVNRLTDITSDILGESKNIKIYSINESDLPVFRKAVSEDKKNTTDGMSNSAFVTVEEMNEYSALLKKEVDGLKERLKTAPTDDSNSIMEKIDQRLAKLENYTKYLAENVDKNIQYSEYLAESLDKDIEYTKYLSENLDRNISYAEYLAENLDKNISFSDYLAENLEKNVAYAEYLAENLDKNISYAEYLAENLDKNISYSEYLAEGLDRNISYSEYLAENLDRNISYSEYLAENLDRGIGYSEYLAEKLEKNIAYSEYIAESVGTTAPKTIDATATPAAPVVNENKSTETIEEVKNTDKPAAEKTDYTALPDKINTLLENAKNQKAVAKLNESKYPFFKFLSDEKRNEFDSLDEAKKEKVAYSLKDGAYFNEADITAKWETALVEQEADKTPAFLSQIPEKIKPLYESLSAEDKNKVLAQSKLRKLDTPYQVKNFWETRWFAHNKPVGLIKLNENETPVKAPKFTNEYMELMAGEIGKRFRK